MYSLQLTIADIALAAALNVIAARVGDDWKKHAPLLTAHVDKVLGMPNIKKWIESRPQTDN